MLKKSKSFVLMAIAGILIICIFIGWQKLVSLNSKNTTVPAFKGSPDNLIDIENYSDTLFEKGLYVNLETFLIEYLKRPLISSNKAKAYTILAKVDYQRRRKELICGQAEISKIHLQKCKSHLEKASKLLEQPGDISLITKERFDLASMMAFCELPLEAAEELEKIQKSLPSTEDATVARVYEILYLTNLDNDMLKKKANKLEKDLEPSLSRVKSDKFFDIAVMYLSIDKLEKAEELFKAYNEIYPHSDLVFESKIYLARIALRKGNKKQAASLLNEVSDKIKMRYNTKDSFNGGKGEVLFGMILDSISDNPDSASGDVSTSHDLDDLSRKAHAAFLERRYSEAVACMDKVISLISTSKVRKKSVRKNGQ
ncbi:MAG: hypothetical protein M1269_04730 [Chloroflexi bacterium]|nr:hypothetical protein [Chloroflexota bacterium]